MVISGRTIEGLIAASQLPADVKIVDAGQSILAPGFIDMHHHGAVGVRADQGPEAVAKISRFLPTTGTTSWLPTVSTLEGVKAIAAARKLGLPGADVAGIHMEGPYLAPKRLPGEEVVERTVNLAEIDGFIEASEGLLRVMGLSPELPNALEGISHLAENGVLPAAAHTKITYEQLMTAVDAGLRHVTHVYNVMSRLHHREPNMVGGVLVTDELTGELIADGFHVHPVAMEILIRCKGIDMVAMISDSATYAGMPDGDYGDVVKKDGVLRRAGFDASTDHTLAGSVWSLDHNLATLVNSTNVTIRDAVTMATLTPARIVGIADRKGSIARGKDADLVVLNQDLKPMLSVVGGRIVYADGLLGECCKNALLRETGWLTE